MKETCYKCKIKSGYNLRKLIKKSRPPSIKIYTYYICSDCSKEMYVKNNDRVIKWQKNNIDKVRNAKLKYSRTKRKTVAIKKDRVRGLVRLAILKGLLIRGNCKVCNQQNAQAHHNDYSKPFDILWFCSKHHREYEISNGLRVCKYE